MTEQPPSSVQTSQPTPTISGELWVYRTADAQTRGMIDKQLERIETRRNKEIALQWGGIVSGLIVALSFLGVSGWLINGDHDVAGTILGSVDIVALVTVFVVRHRSS